MRKDVVAVALVALIAAGLGLGYLTGSGARSTETGTSSSSSFSSSTTDAKTSSAQSSQSSTSSSTVQSSSSIESPTLFFADHLQRIESENLPGVLGDYLPNATVSWDGDADLNGAYSHASNIVILYNSTFLVFGTLTITNETSDVIYAGNDTVVDAHFSINGTIPAQSPFACGAALSENATVVVTAEVIPLAGSWTIKEETWHFSVTQIGDGKVEFGSYCEEY